MHQRYCAFCRSHFFVYPKKKVTLKEIILSGITALAVTLCIWRRLQPQFFLFWILCVVVAEVFVQIRWRVSVVCDSCGFDPVLYKQDTNQAVLKVKRYLAARQEDANYLLTRKLDLPKISSERAAELKRINKGAFISKQA